MVMGISLYIYIYMILNVPYHVPSLDSDHGRVDKIGPSEMGKLWKTHWIVGWSRSLFRSFRISRMDLDWASNIDRTRGWNGWKSLQWMDVRSLKYEAADIISRSIP